MSVDISFMLPKIKEDLERTYKMLMFDDPKVKQNLASLVTTLVAVDLNLISICRKLVTYLEEVNK